MPFDGDSFPLKWIHRLRPLRWPALITLLLILGTRLAVGPMARCLLEEAIGKASTTGSNLKKVQTDWLGGSPTAIRLTIQNPIGFNFDALELQEVSASVPLIDFWNQRVELPEITASRTRVRLETQSQRVNLVELLQRIRARIQENANEPPRRLFRIGSIVLEHLSAELATNHPGAEPSPDIEILGLHFELSDRWYTLEEILERTLVEILESIRLRAKDRMEPELLNQIALCLDHPTARNTPPSDS